VGVHRQRDLDLLVPEPLLDDLGRHAGLEEQRRARVPEPVELYPPDTRGLEEFPELPLAEVVHLQRISEGVPAALEILPFLGEDEAEVAVSLAVPEPELGLLAAVLPEEGDCLGTELDRPRRLVLDRPEDRVGARLHELALDREAPTGEIEVRPLEPAQLPLAGAAVEGERVERGWLRPGRLGGREEGLCLVRLPAVLERVPMPRWRVGLADDELRHVPIDEALEDRGLEGAVRWARVAGASASSPWACSS